MPAIKSEYSCPTCERETGQLNQIIANAGELQCEKNSNHRWNDTMSFYNEKPRMSFKVVAPKFLPQENHTPMSVTIPIPVKTALETKFGDKLNATVASILQLMAEGNFLMVPESDLIRIKERTGKKPESSGELFGMIYSMGMDVDTAKQEAESAKKDVAAYEGYSKGRVLLDLGDQYEDARIRAEGESQPLKVWLEIQVRNALQNSWF